MPAVYASCKSREFSEGKIFPAHPICFRATIFLSAGFGWRHYNQGA